MGFKILITDNARATLGGYHPLLELSSPRLSEKYLGFRYFSFRTLNEPENSRDVRGERYEQEEVGSSGDITSVDEKLNARIYKEKAGPPQIVCARLNERWAADATKALTIEWQ